MDAQRQEERVRWAVLALMLAVVVLLALEPASSVLAQIPTDKAAAAKGPVEGLFAVMRASVHAWQEAGQEWARRIFAPLAALNLMWVAKELLGSGSPSATSAIVRVGGEVFTLSVFYALIELGPDLANELIEFFRSAGDYASGLNQNEEETTFSKMVQMFLAIAKQQVGNIVGFESLWIAAACVLTLVLASIISGVSWIVEFVTHVVVGLGVIVLGGGGSVWTRGLVKSYLMLAGCSGLALYTMKFAQHFVLEQLQKWTLEAVSPGGGGLVSASFAQVGVSSGGTGPRAHFSPEAMLNMVGALIVELLLMLLLPSIALRLMSGGIANIAGHAGQGASALMRATGAGAGVRAVGSALAGGAGKAASGVRTARSSQGGAARGSMLSGAGGARPPGGGGQPLGPGGGAAARAPGGGVAQGELGAAAGAGRDGGGGAEGGQRVGTPGGSVMYVGAKGGGGNAKEEGAGSGARKSSGEAHVKGSRGPASDGSGAQGASKVADKASAGTSVRAGEGGAGSASERAGSGRSAALGVSGSSAADGGAGYNASGATVSPERAGGAGAASPALGGASASGASSPANQGSPSMSGGPSPGGAGGRSKGGPRATFSSGGGGKDGGGARSAGGGSSRGGGLADGGALPGGASAAADAWRAANAAQGTQGMTPASTSVGGSSGASAPLSSSAAAGRRVPRPAPRGARSPSGVRTSEGGSARNGNGVKRE